MSSDIPHVYSCVHTHIVLNPQILCLKPKQKKSVYSQPYFILSFEVFTDGVEDMKAYEDEFRAGPSVMSLPGFGCAYR